MKHIITLIFLFLLLSCIGRPQWQCGKDETIKSTSYDKRCDKFDEEARKKGVEAGVCYSGPLVINLDEGAKDPDPEKCNAIWEEAEKKCDALGPPGPGDIVYTSGSATYRGGKPVMIDGKPLCP